MYRCSPGASGAQDERSCVPNAINIRVQHRISEIDVLVIPLQNLEPASKGSAAGLSTEERFDVVRIFPKQW